MPAKSRLMRHKAVNSSDYLSAATLANAVSVFGVCHIFERENLIALKALEFLLEIRQRLQEIRVKIAFIHSKAHLPTSFRAILPSVMAFQMQVLMYARGFFMGMSLW
jgi:hypothetical protein